MELDDLKNIWKLESFPLKREDELVAMAKGSSKSIISKIKRNAWIELVFTISAGLFLIYYSLIIPEGFLKWYFISYLVLFIGYVIYYLKKINLLNRFDTGSQNIKANIEQLINDLTIYLTFYKKSYSILYPTYILLMLFFVAIDRGMEEFLHALAQPKTLLYLGGICIIFLGCSLWFTKWYLKKLYGDHLLKLRMLLNDIDEKSDGQ